MNFIMLMMIRVASTSAIPASWVDLDAITTTPAAPTGGQARRSPSRYACIPDKSTMQECIINAARDATVSANRIWMDHMRNESHNGLRNGAEWWWKDLLYMVIAK